MTQYFVDDAGAYLGGFDGAEPPEGALEVPSAPDDARQVWDGSQWGPVVLTPADFPSLSPRQIRLALNDIGITSADVATKLAGNEAGTIEWNYATYFKRTHPLIAALTPAFALTEAQVDSLWLYAAEIK
ncbi:hypothetical protein [Mesorhizobium sp. LNJC384A00]|uniref:hypothetical protein n=1 Tax=Mesorhizobium sp. LNJC384A00 TaxID=1287268 RepID=UPI0012EC4419|nr:hypothetical protein [Mesorhizobium sp. LNJC384A00]